MGENLREYRMGFRQIDPSSEEGNQVLYPGETSQMLSSVFQAETYQGEITNDTHGTEGPIKVSFATEHTQTADNFLEVSAAYDKERSLVADVNTFTSCNQYGVSTLLYRVLHTAQDISEMAKVPFQRLATIFADY
jgi:predicted RNA-binding protein with PIN domain